jgi:hypothetical protein
MPYLVKLPSLKVMLLIEQNVTDDDLAALKDWTSLTNLSLRRTKVTDAGLAHVEKLTGLNYLTITGLPGVTDQGLDHLTGLKKLKRIGLQDTAVTPAGIAKLKKALPDVEIKQ